MKRIIIFSTIATFLLSSCSWNVSTGEQNQNSTPVGSIPEFPTQQNATPTFTVEATSKPEEMIVQYYAQSGDWLPAIANRFGVSVSEIRSPKILSEGGLIDPGTLLNIPDRLDNNIPRTPSVQIMPDSEVIFSASAADFDVEAYVRNAAGYLSAYRVVLSPTTSTTGAQVIKRLAYENSINPRLLLALLDYEGHWVRGHPDNQFRIDYPMAYEDVGNQGMFNQMTWAINQLSMGYYGWRSGTLSDLTFSDGSTLRIDPTLNAGTVALMYLFSRAHSLNEWHHIMDERSGFAALYRNIYGDPWVRANALGEFFPSDFRQPDLVLPFEPNITWSFTGGPHSAWETEGPMAAIDFAPSDDKSGCFTATSWIVSTASGVVVRSGDGVVVLDLDGDGSEQTGWNILYLHVAAMDRVALGKRVEQNERIGHASCEGGVSTGTHVHMARKYNGEWMLADGPVPFVLSGWRVFAGDQPYLGKLVKGMDVITADGFGQSWSLITRKDEE